MKKILWIILASITALALAAPSAPAFADSPNKVEIRSSSRAELMIKAPKTADVNEQITVCVFDKHGHETMAGASVYAAKLSDLVIAADNLSYTYILAKYEALVVSKGIFIGTSGDNGSVTACFPDSDRFLLLATKDGFVPGFARLTVKSPDQKTLSVKAQHPVMNGRQVSITVTDRSTNEPVQTAAVYIFKLPNRAFPPVIHQAPEADNGTAKQMIIDDAFTGAVSADEEVRLMKDTDEAVFIGNSDGSGQVNYTFETAGLYIVAAFKDGFEPGFIHVAVAPSDAGDKTHSKSFFDFHGDPKGTYPSIMRSHDK